MTVFHGFRPIFAHFLGTLRLLQRSSHPPCRRNPLPSSFLCVSAVFHLIPPPFRAGWGRKCSEMTHFGAKMTVFFTDFGRFPPYFRAFSDSSSGLRTLPAAGITFLSVSAFFSPQSTPFPGGVWSEVLRNAPLFEQNDLK